MRKSRQKILWPALLAALLLLTAITFAASSKYRRMTTHTVTATSQNQPNPVGVKRRAYVQRSLLSPMLVWNLKALGNRLERPGKERLSVTGTLRHSEDSQAEEVVAVFEFPDRLRLTIEKGHQNRVILFDGEQAKAVGRPLDEVERDLIETLVYGAAEHFFISQAQGQATRFLGARFRLDDGSSANYSGPYYDIYQVADQIKTSANEREQNKFFYFNSDTLLLERVAYEINRDGSTIKVEETTSNWGQEQGQQVARRIERFENGVSVFVLTVRLAGFGQRLGDGIFAN